LKKIAKSLIINRVAQMCQEANFVLNDDIKKALLRAQKEESLEMGKNIFQQLIDNYQLAEKKKVPICQDTGYTVIFVELGEDVKVEGNLQEALFEGVKKGYKEGYLRKSIVKDPFNRENTGDNTPPVIHTEIVSGNKLKLYLMAKGGGSENMSKIKMLSPAQGQEGVIDFVVDTVRRADANPCPPVIVGVGLGGTFEKAALLSKKALLRDLDDAHSDPKTAKLEKKILNKINKLGIGPQGLGGTRTALGVKIEKYPCHIASLPAAVNINCHAARHKKAVL